MKKLLVVLLVLGLASPAMAAQWGWYGTVRTHLGSYATSDSYAGGPTMDSTISGYNNEFDGEADGGLFVNVAGQNTLGARMKVTDQLSAHVELGLTNGGLYSGDDQYSDEGVYLRGVYGKYKMGPGTLLVGKYYTPATFLLYSGMTADVGDMGDAIMLTTGIPYAGRRAQIRFSIAGFEAALVEHVIANGTNDAIAGTDEDGRTYNDADFALPKIELAYQFNHPIFSIRPILGYQSFDVESNSPDDDESETITSTLFGLGVNLRFGMVKVNFSYAQTTNPGNYGIKNVAPVAYASYGATAATLTPHALNLTRAAFIDGDVEDAEGTQAMLTLNFKFNPKVSLELGYGYMKAEQAISEDVDMELVSNVFYLNVPITIGPGMTITPEFGALNRGTVSFSDDVTYYDIAESGTSIIGTADTTTDDELDAGAMAWYAVRFAVSF